MPMPQVGERRTVGTETREWDGDGWVLVTEAAPVDPVVGAGDDPRLDPNRISFRAASSMATSEPQRQEMTPLEEAVTAEGLITAGTMGLGAVGGAVLRPLARGAIAAGKTYARLSPAGKAVKAGVQAAFPEITKAAEARLNHALARTAKEVAETAAPKVVAAAEKVVSRGSTTATPIAPRNLVSKAMPSVEEVTAYIHKQAAAGQSRGQIAATLREQLAAGAEGVGEGRFRSMVDLVLGAAK